MTNKTKAGAPQRGRNHTQISCVVIGQVGLVAAEKLIGPVPGKRNSDVFSCERRKKPDGKGTRVGAGLVRMVGHRVDSASQVCRGIEIEFLMARSVVARKRARVTAFIMMMAEEGNREGPQWRRTHFGGVVEDERGIYASAKKNAERHVRRQVLPN